MPSVIVIDDYVDVANIISDYLRLFSINVLAIGYNGKEAVELYKEHKPDVVVLDHMMPDFNGYYALENILKINPNAKVIFLTSSMNVELPQKLKDAGANEVLIKPHAMNNLVEMINKISSDSAISLSK